MKNKIFISFVFFIGLMVAIFSCTKKESPTKDKPTVQLDDSKIIADIIQFKDRMEYLLKHPKEKSVVKMSVDSAIYFIEGTINVFHGFNFLPPGEVEIHRDTISFPNGDSLTENEVSIKYDEVFQTVRGRYINSSLPEKHLTYVNVKLVNNKGNKQVVVSSAIKGEKSLEPSEEGWMWGDNLGRCNDPTIEGDAAQALTAYINDLYKYPCLGCWTFVNIHEEIIDIDDFLYDPYYFNPDNSDPEDNYIDYKIYYAEQALGTGQEFWTDDTKCVGHGEEEIYYREQAKSIIDDILGEDAMLDEFLASSSQVGSEGLGTKIIWHIYTISYGSLVKTSGMITPTDIQ